MKEQTVFGGCLIRWGIDLWAWSDGTAEPRVKDDTLSAHYNFRIRTYGSGGSYVEVPVDLVRSPSNPELHWVRDLFGLRKDLSHDFAGPRVWHVDTGRVTRLHEDPVTGRLGGRVIPEVYLVPIDEWYKHAFDPVGAIWDAKDEEAIVAKARSLGWKSK